MCSDFEVGKVGHLGFAPFVEADYFLNKGLVITLESLPILLQIENGSALRLHLIDVEVVDASDLITGLGTLNTFFFLSVSLLGGLLRHSEFVLDAEVVVTSLILPEFLEGLAFEFCEFEALLLDGHVGFDQLID